MGSHRLIVLTIILTVPTRLGYIDVHFPVGALDFDHILTLVGTFFIAIYTPIYSLLKRRRPEKLKVLLNIHIFGSLISFLFISLHYAGETAPRTGEGLALYIIVAILVATGWLYRFNLIPENAKKVYPPHFNRWFHISLITAFYIVVIIHTLKRTGILF